LRGLQQMPSAKNQAALECLVYLEPEMSHFTEQEAHTLWKAHHSTVGLVNAAADTAIAKLAAKAGMPMVCTPQMPFSQEQYCKAADVREALAAMQAKVEEMARVVEFANKTTESVMEKLEQAQAENVRYRELLKGLVGTEDDPKNGWRGTQGTDVLFACEYCGKLHEDFTKIVHLDDCPVMKARAALKEHRNGDYK
jgi:alkanesulfonate monooxygenase SsuD/methylene tetrahydromethanopterin reductase-like flavin-dependent oxidoreductase (luciferase family)